MQFTVPKFLERETKIVFGLTLKKLAILGCIGLLLFILKFFLNKGFWYFLVFLSIGMFFFLNFVRVGGQNVFELLANTFNYFLTARVYTWDKKEQMTSPIKLVRKTVVRKIVKVAPLKFAPASRLSGLRSRVDFGDEPETPVEDL
ncbi:MAG: PrgI family protein [Candidatus Gribaldobacteria bacterium]|nr:PrgI family protein [Candidatus Gribaldobacteria bacterium]